MPYRYGYMATSDPEGAPGSCLARVDNATRTYQLYNAGPTKSFAEPVFAPKSPGSGEGVGYLMAVQYNLDQGNRGDLVILDAEHLEDGPIATVKLKTPASPQVHGWWVREDQYPG
jgi:carotenoid cleavage dioxygenase